MLSPAAPKAVGAAGGPAKVRPPDSRRDLRVLSRSQTAAFVGRPHVRCTFPLARRVVFPAAMAVLVSVCELRRLGPGTTSLVLIPPRRHRAGLVVRVGLVAVCVLALMFVLPTTALSSLWSELVFVGVMAVLAVVGASIVLGSLKEGPARKRLRAMRPDGPYWLVTSMANTGPKGQGAVLLHQLEEEADAKGWVLVLEAANPRLVEYYSRFGFMAVGEGEVMPWAEPGPDGQPAPAVVTCMVRRPVSR